MEVVKIPRETIAPAPVPVVVAVVEVVEVFEVVDVFEVVSTE